MLKILDTRFTLVFPIATSTHFQSFHTTLFSRSCTPSFTEPLQSTSDNTASLNGYFVFTLVKKGWGKKSYCGYEALMTC